MKMWTLVTALTWACGNAEHAPGYASGGSSYASGGALGSGAAGVSGFGGGGTRAVVLAPAGEALPVCDVTRLEVSGADGSDNWAADPLLFPTSWHTFRGHALRGPIDALTGIWVTGMGSEPFEDRELRAFSSALIASNGQFLCAAGTRRALRNGVYAAVELDGLGPLTCSGEVVPGELRYCHDCENGDYAITGSLDGEKVVEVTGSHARAGDTLFLEVGWGVLIAEFAPEGAAERLRAGAYLSFTNQVYCFDSATGDARDIATADVTFTGFRRAAPCSGESIHSFARACVKQFDGNEKW